MEEKQIIKKEETPSLLMVAKALYKSGLFPSMKNEFGAFAIVQYGHELGIGPMTSLQTMAIISGKICMAGQMMLSIALRNGVKYRILKDTETECQIEFKKGELEYISSFSIEEAKKAGIYKAQSGWEKYPRDMLFWRTVTRGLRRICPDLILGLYAKEELEDAPPINGSEIIDIPTQEIPQEKPHRKDFDFLKKMSEAKKAFKELCKNTDKYYEILMSFGYEHADQVKDEDKENIYVAMREAYKEIAKNIKESNDENIKNQ